MSTRLSNVPLVDLQAQYRSIKGEIDRAIQTVLDRGQFILGPEVEAFEREMAAYCGAAHAVAVASGTDALELALRACGIGPGDEVITTAFSFFATVEAILEVGATPVFADLELATYTIDPDDVAKHITPRTKAILPVHLYGHPADMDRLLAIAQQHHLKVIEDCAQAAGAAIRGRRVGTFGDAGCLSFYPSKNLGGYGDGGMVVTNDARVADEIRLLRNHGSRTRYQHVAVGTNSRLDELQAAVLRVKLCHVDAWNEARRRNATLYVEALSRQDLPGLVLPQERPNCRHVYALFCIQSPDRDAIARTLAEQHIATQIAYPSTLPAQAALAQLPSHMQRVPVAEQAARQILALPMYPELTPEAIREIASTIASSTARR